MKKGSLKLIAVLIFALLFVSIAAVSAQPNDSGAIKCDLDITYDFYDGPDQPAYWLGEVADCVLAGTIRFDAIGAEYRFRPKPDNFSTMHFVEDFIIWPGNTNREQGGDDWIEGKNCGVWTLSTFKFRAQGWVTDASEDYADLVGNQYHEMGTTTPFHGDPDEIPILAPDGKMKLVPGNRPVDSPEGLCAPPEEPGE